MSSAAPQSSWPIAQSHPCSSGVAPIDRLTSLAPGASSTARAARKAAQSSADCRRAVSRSLADALNTAMALSETSTGLRLSQCNVQVFHPRWTRLAGRMGSK